MRVSITSKNAALLIAVFVVSSIAGCFILAWNEPTSPAPEGNVATPINIGSVTQTKGGNFNILGMVGIGTTAPSQKLDVIGGNVKGDGLCIGNQCCYSWEECVAFGGGSCKATNVACNTNSECCSSICTGGLCANTPVCTANGINCSNNSDCCSTSCTGGLCTGGQYCKDSLIACSSDSERCSGDCSSGYCTNYYPCGKPSPAGIKQIFTTSGLYSGYAFTANGESLADAKCQDAAYVAKLTAKSSTNGATGPVFKAMIYLGTRQINTILASGNEFRNPKKNGAVCDLVPVASNASDFFSVNGVNYLINAIANDETGKPITPGTTVWTNYKADSTPLDDTYASWVCTGNSNYHNVRNFRNVCHENGYYLQRYYDDDGNSWDNCEEGQHWYGNPNAKTTSWAYQNKVYFRGYGNYNNGTNYPHDACINLNRALYCVEQ